LTILIKNLNVNKKKYKENIQKAINTTKKINEKVEKIKK